VSATTTEPDVTGPPDPQLPTAVVFDLGGVLLDWNPRYLDRSVFDDQDEMERFLAEVVSADWNHEQDAGRPWAEAIELLAAEHPAYRAQIEAYHLRWPEMLGGALEGTVAVLEELVARGLPAYALSNWSSETFVPTRDRFAFLDLFRGIMISGDVGVAKPDPAIFELFLERFGLDPRRTVYIDDLPRNVAAAGQLGFRALRFVDSETLRRDLAAMGLLDGPTAGRPWPG
jgi:2-haloacid dehalogenase